MPKPKVSIITVSYNRKHDLLDALRSINEQNYLNKEIIVVDNASTDGTVDAVRKKFPEIKIISLNKNVGLHKGFNIGVNISKGEIVIGIDQDCVLKNKNIVTKVISKFKKNPKLGIVAFRIKNFSDGKDAWDNPTHLYLNGNKSGYPCLSYNGSGFAFLKKIYLEAGGLDEQFFIYYGELDLTLRIIDLGYECRYFPDIIVFHKSEKRKISQWYQRLTNRNYIWFGIKNFSPFETEFYKPIISVLAKTFLKNPLLGFQIFFDVLKGLPQIIRKRKYLSRKTIRYKYLFRSQKFVKNKKQG